MLSAILVEPVLTDKELTDKRSAATEGTEGNPKTAGKTSPEKQNKNSHLHPGSREGRSHSQSGRLPHSHSASGFGIPGGYGVHMSHGGPHMMPNGFMDPAVGGGYHPAMFPPYPHHLPPTHMDPANQPGMEYRNGFGGPAPYPPAGFYPPHHQRTPFYPSPPHSGGMPPYQMPPHHNYPAQQGKTTFCCCYVFR